MSFINHYAVILLICSSLRTLRAEDNFFELSTSTNSETFKPSGNVTFRCTVFTSRTDVGNGVQWFRRQGTLTFMIATEIFPNVDFDSNQRYSFDRGGGTRTTFTYVMKISNLQLQDSATIECGNPRFTKRASLAFAVCDDPRSESCNCMVKTGWASPACFNYLIDAKENYDSYHQAIVGLGVGLAVAIIIAIILTFLTVKKCTRNIAASLKDKEDAVQRESLKPPPAASLAPPGVSVLKQPSRTSGPASHSVRFSEDDHDARNLHIMPELSGQAVNQGARPNDFIPRVAGGLYPSLDALAYPTPDGAAQGPEFKQQTLPERSFINAQDLPPHVYQPHGLQHSSGQPFVVPQPSVAPLTAGAVYNQGAAFVDPGSTSV